VVGSAIKKTALYWKGGIKISQSPKIKILLPAGYPDEDPFELEEARSRLNFASGMILVDGQRLRSYDDLVRLAALDKYQNQEYIEVVAIMLIAGG